MNYRVMAALGLAVWLITGGCTEAEGTIRPAAAENFPKIQQEETNRDVTFMGEIDGTPLTNQDFVIDGLHLGESLSECIERLGNPISRKTGSTREDCLWSDLRGQFVQDTAYIYSKRPDLTMNQTFPSAGAVKIGIMNSAISTSREIHVGDSREKVVRSYGRPAQIVWNGPQKQLYLIYEKDAKQLIFTIQDNRVKEILLSFAGEEFPVSHPEAMTSGLRFTDEDFCIAGYKPETDFQEHSWLIWEKKAANPEEEIWYFPGFGVRMDSRTRRISSLFITDNGMVTHRGISLGDQLSTLEFLYGEPQKLEMNLADTHPQSAYIYFSKDKETVLVFYINEKEKTIQNIVSMKNPQIPNPLQPALDRIRNVRTINQQRGK